MEVERTPGSFTASGVHGAGAIREAALGGGEPFLREEEMRRAILGTVCAIVSTFSLVGCGRSPHGSITWDKCDAIEPGMTRREVEFLLKALPGNHAIGDVRVMDGPGYFFSPTDFMALDWGNHSEFAIWVGQEAAAVVYFDRQGRVSDTHVCRVYPTSLLKGKRH
jgi:hypothetical protein